MLRVYAPRPCNTQSSNEFDYFKGNDSIRVHLEHQVSTKPGCTASDESGMNPSPAGLVPVWQRDVGRQEGCAGCCSRHWAARGPHRPQRAVCWVPIHEQSSQINTFPWWAWQHMPSMQGELACGQGSALTTDISEWESALGSPGFPAIPGCLSCRSQTRIWSIFSIFKPTSLSWQPSKHFCLSKV